MTNKQEHYEVTFENAKLIDEKIDGKTGVKVDVYTIERGSEYIKFIAAILLLSALI